ncbi:MAG: sigma-70 family RNA polymerase sigma factor [bacterium]|nr:sigma-70 family RNA polymerase sigma factor [bacterium]
MSTSAVCAPGSTSTSSGLQAPKRTFRRKKLELEFLKYCQLSTETSDQPLSRAEFQQLWDESTNYIHSEDFTRPSAETEFLGDDFLSECGDGSARRASKKVNLPPHLIGLTETRLLTPDQERKLFQRMNFLRYKAVRILEKCEDSQINQWDLERVQGLLRAANWHRDLIVKANVRLVISIVKKFVNPQCGFDDLLSDGIMALIRSVDKFDYQLGFRFSTYATQVVRRNSYRFVMERQDERLKVTNSINEPGLDVVSEPNTSSMSETRWNTLRGQLNNMLDLLDRREKLIIRARFSLGSHREVKTLQRLADRLGISKERVRQLEKRALEKLQAMAVANPPEIVEVEAA